MNLTSLLFASAFSVWWVDPYGDKPYLPDAEPAGGVVTNVLGCAAARGEIETVSFSVRPERDLSKVDFVPSDLTGPDGAKIPASAADFALVKCWYRAGGRWGTSWSGHTGKPELINDLVLHDNDLIRVEESEDYVDRTILVRMSYPEGPVWVDMKKHGRGGDHFRHELFPVMDAKKFVPFDLKKDRFQQYWLTWKVPADAKPGLYRGTLLVKEDGRDLDSLPLELEVYPFELPTARTHYDTSRRFISSWMGTPTIGDILKHGKDLASAERKVFNIYRSLADHNAHEPSAPGLFKENSTDDLNVRSLILMRRAGMDCDTLIGGPSGEFWWAANPEAPFISPEQDPALYARQRASYLKKLEVQAAVYDKYLGHRNNYFCGPDECGSYMHYRLYGFFTDIHKMGMFTWGDSGVAKDVAWSLDMDDAPAAARHTRAWEWHNGSAKVVTYAGTFTGPSCPDIWRRTKGLRYYYADFDGLHEYTLYYNRWNHWNDFKWRGNYTQMQIVYPTYDGIIATIAWEGVREGLDDIRYLSLLRLRAEAAMKSSDPKVRAAGRRHFVWMDLQDPERVIDLFAFRREVARRCCELIGLVGPQPSEPATLRPVPELPPCRYGQSVPDGADLAKLAAEYEKNDRYDLAIGMLGKIAGDTSRPMEARVAAAIRKATLESEILRRDDSLKTVAEALSWKSVDRAQRGKLLLRRVRTLLTERVYEEEFTVAQLDAAAAVLAEAMTFPGVSQDERFDALISMVSAYQSGSAHEKAVAYIDARLADVKLKDQQKCDLMVRKAQSLSALEKWDESAKAYRLAHQIGNCNTREVFKAEGYVAEQREDWKTAQACYLAESKTYNEEEADLKASCEAKLKRITGMLNKSSAGKGPKLDDEGETDISLDE